MVTAIFNFHMQMRLRVAVLTIFCDCSVSWCKHRSFLDRPRGRYRVETSSFQLNNKGKQNLGHSWKKTCHNSIRGNQIKLHFQNHELKKLSFLILSTFWGFNLIKVAEYVI